MLCPPRRCFCWKGWHSRHGLMLVVMTTGGGCCVRVEQGRKGRETDGGGEGLSQQEVRRGGSRHSAGMEDTLGDVDITGTRRFCTFCLMTLLCTGRVWACLRCCMPAAETLLASHTRLLGPMWWAQPGKIMPSATASANYCNRSLMGSAGSRSMTSFSLQIFLGMLARQIKKKHLITKSVSS